MLALIASDVDAIEGTVGLVCALSGIVRLDRWDRAAGIASVSSRHVSGKRVEMTRDNHQSPNKHLPQDDKPFGVR